MGNSRSSGYRYRAQKAERVKPGDKSLSGLIAREAIVIAETKNRNVLGVQGVHAQEFTVKYGHGQIAHGEHIIDRPDKQLTKKIGIAKPVTVGQKVIIWAPDRRRGIYYASIANNTKYR